ncbi:hypothetical protein STEG23_001527, partial [Scotinomys teguina]
IIKKRDKIINNSESSWTWRQPMPVIPAYGGCRKVGQPFKVLTDSRLDWSAVRHQNSIGNTCCDWQKQAHGFLDLLEKPKLRPAPLQCVVQDEVAWPLLLELALHPAGMAGTGMALGMELRHARKVLGSWTN